MKPHSILLMALVSMNLACQTVNPNKLYAADNEAGLVEFSSNESIERLSAANAKVDFFTLANQFEAQSNGLFCGPTTAAIVLNSLRAGKADLLPKDRSRLNESELQYLPNGFDPAVARYTQETVLTKSPKPRIEVFGKPVQVAGKEVKDFGYQLRQFDALLKSHGLNTQLRVVDDNLNDDIIVSEMVQNLKRRGDYVIVNYKRAEVGQEGGGHISPVGAYDEDSHSFLILDVNPAKASWVWMPAETLIKGMRSFDTVENRGYILVQE